MWCHLIYQQTCEITNIFTGLVNLLMDWAYLIEKMVSLVVKVAFVRTSDWHHLLWPVASWSVCRVLDLLKLVHTLPSQVKDDWS